MQYKVESLPSVVAARLPELVSQFGIPPERLAVSALAVAADGERYRLGVVAENIKAEDVPPEALIATVADGVLVPAPPRGALTIGEVRLVPGPILRSLVAAMTQHIAEHPKTPLSPKVRWRTADKTVVVMVGAARGDQEASVVGGSTQSGREVHYHVDVESFTVVRRTLGR